MNNCLSELSKREIKPNPTLSLSSHNCEHKSHCVGKYNPTDILGKNGSNRSPDIQTVNVPKPDNEKPPPLIFALRVDRHYNKESRWRGEGKGVGFSILKRERCLNAVWIGMQKRKILSLPRVCIIGDALNLMLWEENLIICAVKQRNMNGKGLGDWFNDSFAMNKRFSG